jgi:single-strand DNA-binding protein
MSSININSVIVNGRLTYDPKLYEQEYSEAQGEPVYTILKLAINGRNGKGEQRAIFYDVKVWNSIARACVEYLRKGALVSVQGRLDQYNHDGDRWNYVTAERVEFVDGVKKRGDDE